MMENDDRLIRQFMQKNKHEISDNGFSRRVVRMLPKQIQWLSDLLSVLCTIVCCILFYVFNGFGLLIQAIGGVITSQSYYLINDVSFRSLIIATLILIVVGVQRACTVKG